MLSFVAISKTNEKTSFNSAEIDPQFHTNHSLHIFTDASKSNTYSILHTPTERNEATTHSSLSHVGIFRRANSHSPGSTTPPTT